jgi:phage shock protein PspC (stress-responsive transcriptional regulator)
MTLFALEVITRSTGIFGQDLGETSGRTRDCLRYNAFILFALRSAVRVPSATPSVARVKGVCAGIGVRLLSLRTLLFLLLPFAGLPV